MLKKDREKLSNRYLVSEDEVLILFLISKSTQITEECCQRLTEGWSWSSIRKLAYKLGRWNASS
jgi:hypothetical protein